VRVAECPAPGKIGQLNHVLPSLRGEIVVNTDVDARVAPDALRQMAAEFGASPDVGVVGAYCRPADALAIERHYWATQNTGRLLESDAGASPIAIAQCYGFRRELVRAFPDDVVADDIYVAFLAATRGLHSVYSRQATAVETRGPKDVSEFLAHKLRKSNAYLRESLRFAYRLPEMPPLSKLMLLTRISQQLLLPWVMLFWLLIAAALLTLFRFDLVAYASGFLVCLLLATKAIFQFVRLPDEPDYSPVTVVFGYILTNVILLATALTYPFFRQNSSYSRLPSSRADAARHEPN
jgi:cellulose synthase/poly-beta-1,6-N-acetylglucosamine synthase-like glycosyltransferase